MNMRGARPHQNWPHFTTGIGKLSAEVLNRLFAKVDEIDMAVGDVDTLKSRRPMQPEVFDRFDALLVGYDIHTTNRFRYAWVEAVWSSSVSRFIEKTGGRNSYDGDWNSSDPSAGTPFNAPAWNTIENGNNGLRQESGVDIEGPNYPEGFWLQPIQGDPQENPEGDYEPVSNTFWEVNFAPVVEIRIRRDTDGAVAYFFTAVNQHDGVCDE